MVKALVKHTRGLKTLQEISDSQVNWGVYLCYLAVSRTHKTGFFVFVFFCFCVVLFHCLILGCKNTKIISLPNSDPA